MSKMHFTTNIKCFECSEQQWQSVYSEPYYKLDILGHFLQANLSEMLLPVHQLTTVQCILYHHVRFWPSCRRIWVGQFLHSFRKTGFLQAEYLSCHPAVSVKALKGLRQLIVIIGLGLGLSLSTARLLKDTNVSSFMLTCQSQNMHAHFFAGKIYHWISTFWRWSKKTAGYTLD